MSGRDDFGAGRQDLAARNAALRDQIDNMLSDLRRRTAEIQEKQDAAARQTFEVASDDGMVTVRVDATGTVQELALSSKAFERTTPEKLARSITSVIREASGTAQRRLQSEFAPLADTSDVPDVPGVPSLAGLLNRGPLVQPPDPELERRQRREEDTAAASSHRSEPPQVRTKPEDDWDDDWNWDDNRRGGRR
ncbi:Conserved DNA-binding protein YbaB [Saccharopolyspora kobensis]|uniref:Conserved DNA-binding protein YbaB n=1 Tax=Saccharopolyspora kobensis TaxID=146035 RepID=A0A1H6E6A0_9PSEU|nr:YbaB/EbfC family nucleoid-associated protein [Saccharopolyspora kobensis]SEG92496.1 Conserved DNA-binding protein YbaB [Saccharopolyspora kobensis]SFD38552.1 Conserved DNA-binding protein YbaB [Saccharopolyspora kobensis]